MPFTVPVVGEGLKVEDVYDGFGEMVNAADNAVEQFLADNTDANGVLDLTTEESLELQKLMSEQSISAQAGTSTLKGIADSIKAAARNI